MKNNKTLLILTIKKTVRDGKTSYQLKDYKQYPRLSLYKALYLSNECQFWGRFYKEGSHKYVHPFNQQASEIIGISPIWNGIFTFVAIGKHQELKSIKEDYNGLGGLSLFSYDVCYPMYKQTDLKRHKYLFEELSKKLKNNKTYKYLKDSSYWGAISCMPKCWHHVKTGTVQIGDYFWDDHTFKNGYYTPCEISFSPLKPGKLIEFRTCAYVTTSKKTGQQHTLYRNKYWPTFIIRKNK